MNFLNPFDVRRGEGRKTLLMFLYFFLTILVLYVLKPVRSSLFLEELGSENLRYVYLGEGLLLLFVTWAYVQLAKKLPKKRLFSGVLLSFVVSLVIFWWLFLLKVPYLSAFFYVWVACFSITSVTQFWTLANDLYDPLEAKRLFGLIISGGSAGGVLGGIFTSQAVRWVRTEDLLLISAVILLGCIALITLVWRYVPGSSAGTHSGAEVSPEAPSVRKLFFSSSYLWMIAGVVLLAKVASTVVDNQFNAAVEVGLVGKEAKTAFFGAFSAGLNVISFLMQLYATSASLRLLGLGISLVLLPAGLGLASLATFLYPVLWTSTSLKVFDGSMNYSIQQAAKEVLYLPLSSPVRYRIKPVIDMLVYRASKSLGGLLIIFLTPLFSIPNERVGILVLALIPFWIPLVWKTRSTYLARLRENLLREKRDEEVRSKGRRPTEVLNFLEDEASLSKLRSFLTEESTIGRKMAAAAHLVYHRGGKGLEKTRRLVNEMIRWEALESVSGEGESRETLREKELLDELLLREVEKEVRPEKPRSEGGAENTEITLKHLAALLEDPKQGMALKRKVARFLEYQATQEAADRTTEILSKTEVHALRFLLMQALLRMKERNPAIRWNRDLIKKAILQETELYQKLEQIRHFYLEKAHPKKEEFLEMTLRALGEETLERVFRCLELLYPSESLAVIFDRLVEHPESDVIRSHAIELLHNLLGPEFSGDLERLFNEKTLRETSEEKIVTLLEEISRSRDRWLWLAAHFLVAELGLEMRWPKLEAIVSPRSFEFLDV